jgi:TusA-related sulfurtransferase
MRTHDDELDLSGVPCPQNAARTIMRLGMMDEGEVLLITVDDGEPIELVPGSVEADGHSILEQTQQEGGTWKLWIEVC